MKELFKKISTSPKMLKNLFKSPSVFIQTGWDKLSKIPGGKQLFSKLAGQYIPYTGSIHPKVEKISDGSAIVAMRDCRAVRNHLNSIHAIALANLGEFTTGLSLYSQLKNDEKAILVKLEVNYLKKARGDLFAEVFFQLPKSFQSDTDFELRADIKNKDHQTVAYVVATWRVRL